MVTLDAIVVRRMPYSMRCANSGSRVSMRTRVWMPWATKSRALGPMSSSRWRRAVLLAAQHRVKTRSERCSDLQQIEQALPAESIQLAPNAREVVAIDAGRELDAGRGLNFVLDTSAVRCQRMWSSAWPGSVAAIRAKIWSLRPR